MNRTICSSSSSACGAKIIFQPIHEFSHGRVRGEHLCQHRVRQRLYRDAPVTLSLRLRTLSALLEIEATQQALTSLWLATSRSLSDYRLSQFITVTPHY